MNTHDYCTMGGKNMIEEYLDRLPKKLCMEGYSIRHKLLEDGYLALQYLNTRQLRGKRKNMKLKLPFLVREKLVFGSEGLYAICKS